MSDRSQLLGFVVAGFVGTEPSEEGARVVPVLATDQDSAIVAVMKQAQDFTVVGCMSETELESHLSLIKDLRRKQSGTV
jgi:hypothetical protein